MAARMASMKGVELFSAGKYRQEDGSVEEFTAADINRIAENFKRLSTGANPLHRVPIVLGHDEGQPLLQSEGLAAAGWLDDAWPDDVHEGDVLSPGIKGNFADVPEPIANAINRKAYRKLSVEIDNFVDNTGKDWGPTLRRVAILGADIPKDKGLADLPAAFFTDHRTAKAKVAWRSIHKFSEGKNAMNRQQLIEWLAQKGVTVSDSITDEVLQAMAQALGGGMADPNQQGQMSDDKSKAGAAAAAPPVAGAAPAVTPPLPITGQHQQQPASILMKFSEEDRKLYSEIKEQFATIQRLNADRITQEKRGKVKAFCERMLTAGKIKPREMDATAKDADGQPIPTVFDRLMRADCERCVSKFAEKSGKQVERTELDLQMAEIEARADGRRDFSEKFKQPDGKELTGDEAIKAKARQYAERRNKVLRAG